VSKSTSLFEELKRRKVFRVAIAYLIVAWVVIQIATTTFDPLRLPDWSETLVVVIAIVGFPIALILAWAFETTPDGVRRDSADTVEVTDASIAVLPFINMSDLAENEYFSDGLAEELLTMLSRISSLRVCSRTSSFSFKGKNIDVPTVARKLGVKSVLEGSVQRVDNRVRISAQLIDATTDTHLWADNYDREIDDIFAVQDEIAEQIVGALQLKLTSDEHRAVTDQTTDNFEAYDYCLRGRDLFHRSDSGHLNAALEMFDKAIELDPDYALAHAGRTYCLVDLYQFHGRNKSHLEQAVVSSKKAIEMADHLAESHAARGLALWPLDEFDAAEDEFERAISINPRLFEALHFYSRMARVRGQIDKAIELSRKAAAARPDDYQAMAQVSQLCRESGRQKEADESGREALQIAERAIESNPKESRAMLYAAIRHVEIGNPEKGRKLVERAISVAPDIGGTYFNAACFYTMLGELDRALDLIEQAFEAGNRMKGWYETDSDLDPLRDHERFKALMERF
jgi:adenylate cyclase